MSISFCIMLYHHHFFIYHVPRRHMIYRMYHLFSFVMLYHVISCRVFDDTWTWYLHMIYDDIWWYNAKIGLRTPRPPPYMISHDITWYHVPRPQPKPPEHKLWYHYISCSIMNNDTTWYIMIHVMIHEYKNTEMSPRYRMIYDDIRWYGEDDLVASWQLTYSRPPACAWQGSQPQHPQSCHGEPE